MPVELILALPFLVAAGLGIYFNVRARREANRRASNRVLHWHEEHKAEQGDAPPSQKWTVL